MWQLLHWYEKLKGKYVYPNNIINIVNLLFYINVHILFKLKDTNDQNIEIITVQEDWE